MDAKVSTSNLTSPEVGGLKPAKSSALLAAKSLSSQTPSTLNLNAPVAVPVVEPAPIAKPPIGEALAPGNNNEIPLDGILALFLSGMTQDIFKIKSNEDVTAEKPIKIIPKADIVADVMARRAVSDFQPYLAMIQAYPADELLLYFDAEFKYGQNFFMCTTPAAVDAILRPKTVDPVVAEEAAMAALGIKIKKKPVSKPWECLGSDKDIELEQVFNTRDPIFVKISRQRREFGKDCNFEDKETVNDPVTECKSYKDPAYEVNRLEMGMAVQCIPEMTTVGVQTNWFRPINFSVQYEPQGLSEEEKKILLDTDEVIDFVKSIADSFDQVIQQNSILNIFVDDLKEIGEEEITFEKGTHAFLQEYQSFTDLEHSKDKSISCSDWHPTLKGVVAVSCSERVTLEERIERGFVVKSKQSLILIWSFHDPIHPQLILEAPEDIISFQFNPSDPHFIAGGCINGQIVLWDISEHEDKLKTNRKRSDEEGTTGSAGGGGSGEEVDTAKSNDEPIIPIIKYIVSSSIEFSHRGAITDLQWLPSNMLIAHNGDVSENPESGNRQIVTCSADGQMCVWDTRSKKVLKELDLAWKPFLRVPLSAMDNTFDYGLTKVSLKSLDISAEAAAAAAKPKSQEKGEEGDKKKDAKKDNGTLPVSKFFTATEEGDLIFSDWVAEKSTEEKGSRVEHTYSMHFGPMSDLQRSPFFPDILLSAGGWSFHIWKEKINSGPLLSSPVSPSYIISGRWSPTRPGVFFISKADGTIEAWDILDSTYQPATVQNVASVGISHMSIKQYPGKGVHQFVAAADDEGTLHILEVPKNLTKPLKNEKHLARGFFDREVKRIAYVSERKQIRVREKGQWEQAKLEAAQALKAQAAASKKPDGEADGAAPAAAAAPAAEGSGEPVKSKEEELMDKAEQEYLKFERNFLEAEGLLKTAEI
ncbi:WD40-repeat-containing domain protein [Obelidium mucronatum]|nr:WD40-repeat-containing domain protein [Obelidium mucronatum]